MKVELSYNIYRPEDYALGIIQVVHGMSEYGQRYEKFAQYMCKKGFVVITYDHRGHGPTCAKEDLGFFDSEDGWLRLIEDAHFITDVVKREYPPNVPFILLMNDGRTRDMDSRALAFLERFDAKTTVVDAKDYGLGSLLSCGVAEYFSPMLISAVLRVYAEQLAIIRNHPLTKRRYMWKLEY